MDHQWILPAEVRDQLKEDGQRRWPEEACGLLFGTRQPGRTVIEHYLPVRNQANEPLHAFDLDPAVWVKSCFDPQLVGLYHTHPTSLPQPSPEDLRQLPNFAAAIRLYLIGSPAAAMNKPSGRPDGLALNGYAVERRSDGSAALRAVCLHEK